MVLDKAQKCPVSCRDLVLGEPQFVGVKDASLHVMGGIIFGHKTACVLIVFCLEIPQDIKDAMLKTHAEQGEHLTNSDLDMTSILLLLLIMEQVCDIQPGTHIAHFSNNSPMVR